MRHALALVTSGESPLARSTTLRLHEIESGCVSCSSRNVCLPVGLEVDLLQQLEQVISHQLFVRRRTALYRSGDSFTGLYAIRVGTFKTVMITHDGYGQITGFHMTGDLLGFDGIWDNHHTCEAIALEDSEVCVLPFDRLDALAAVTPSLRHNLYRIMSTGARGDHDITLTFGSRPAEQRLVLFLLNLAERYQLRGYSASEFTLRMTRGDIASFLGLTIETVSRLFSHFHEEGLIQVQGRAIKVLDRPALRERIGGR